jgi:hypothetical protein
MTTASQVKRAVQPLLQRNTDLALVGRLVVIKPVHHILRAISISRSLDANLFVPTWFVMLMFRPSDSVTFNWGDRIYRPTPGRWDVTDPEASPLMCDEIERVALPILRKVQSIDDLVKFASRKRFKNYCLDLNEQKKIYVDVARGNLESAIHLCALLAKLAKTASFDWEREESDKIAKTFEPLLATSDRTGLAQVLRDCEAYSAKKLKLEKLWEPAPFPLELQAAERGRSTSPAGR